MIINFGKCPLICYGLVLHTSPLFGRGVMWAAAALKLDISGKLGLGIRFYLVRHLDWLVFPRYFVLGSVLNS
jgi:hypothetical protein